MLEKLKRLPEMGAPEIGWRLRERVLIGLERAAGGVGLAGVGLLGGEESDGRFLRRLDGAVAPLPGRGTRQRSAEPVLRMLREQVAPRFYLPADRAGRETLAAVARRRFGDWLPRIVAAAERLREHRIEILGWGEVECGPEIDWNRDPVTGAAWEERFWADYDLVHDTPAGGDPKRVHELNRHQHLPRLAKAYFLTGEERYAREAVAQLLGWVEQNPPGRGINWHSSLEIALRAVSWLWTLAFLLGARSLDEAAARRIGKSLFAQIGHVARHPSLYSSPNTHLLCEAAALFVGGMAFAGCARGRAWLARGAELLAAEAERQVCADGVHGELSPWYHCYALDAYLQAVALARHNRWELPPALVHRVEAMLEALLHLLRPDGTLPRLGDDDGGRALALAATDYDRPADLLCTGAVLFGRGVFKAAAGAFREESLWLLGAAGRREYEALPEEVPPATRASFPDAGYFVQRTGWGPDAAQLIFDCGGLGTLGGGHGHADALSVSLFAGGRELLVDPGTFVYNGASEWRDHFRSTGAHNTVRIDGRDQSEPGDTFRWRRRAEARRLDDAGFEGLDYVAGEHDGYAGAGAEGEDGGGDGVVHRRRVLHVRPDYWLVLDDFRGRGEHTFEVLYHLAPESEPPPVEVAEGGQGAELRVRAGGSGLLLAVHASAPLEVETARGEEEPPRGWMSRRYGERRPAPVVIARFRSGVPAAAMSLLVPGAAADGAPAAGWQSRPLPVRPAEGGTALALKVCHRDGEDIAILAPGGGAVEAGPCRGRGELFWMRLSGGRPVRVFAVAADSLEVEGEPVPLGPGRLSYRHALPPQRSDGRAGARSADSGEGTPQDRAPAGRGAGTAPLKRPCADSGEGTPQDRAPAGRGAGTAPLKGPCADSGEGTPQDRAPAGRGAGTAPLERQ